MSAPTHPDNPSGLLRNQFRKETRQHAWFITIAIALAAMELIDGLMVTSHPFNAIGNRTTEGNFSILIFISFVLTALAFAVKIGYSDAPANPSGFIHTRPVPHRAVWGAKSLTLLIFLLIPALSVPFVVGLVHGNGISHAALASLDRLAIFAPALAIALCVAGLCRNAGQLARTILTGPLVVYFGAMLVGGGLILAFGEPVLDATFDQPGAVFARVFLWLCLAATVAALLLWREICGARWKWRPLTFVGTAAALAIACLFTPGLNFLNQSPPAGLPPGESIALDQIKMTPDPYTISMWEDTTGGLRLQSKAEIQNIPEGYYIDHWLTGTRIKFEDGTSFQSGFERRWGEEIPSENLLYALAKIYHGDLRILRPDFGRDLRQNFASSALWSEESLAERLDEESEIEFQYELQPMKLTRVATLPLRDRATATSPTGDAEFTLFHPAERRGASAMFGLRTRMPQRWLTADPTESFINSSDQNSFRHLCLLVRPGHRDAIFCAPSGLTATRGVFTGDPEVVQIFNYGRPEDIAGTDPASGDDTEVHIFKMTPYASIHVESQLGPLRLADKSRVVSYGSSPQRLEYPQYLSALARLGTPPPEDPASLSRYLGTLAATVDRAQNRGNMEEDPAFETLLGIGRTEGLDPLLGHLVRTGFSGSSAWFFLAAMNQLATDSDKASVIAALSDVPDVAQVIVDHGWEQDAKAEIMSLLEQRSPMPYSLLQAANLHTDPATHPFLLEQFEHSMNPGTYDLLRAQPALRPGLDAAVRERWNSTYRLVEPDDNDHDADNLTQLALRFGDEVAFEQTFENVLRDPNDYTPIHALRQVMLLPDGYTDHSILPLKGTRPTDYIYDPLRRIFIRK